LWVGFSHFKRFEVVHILNLKVKVSLVNPHIRCRKELLYQKKKVSSISLESDIDWFEENILFITPIKSKNNSIIHPIHSKIWISNYTNSFNLLPLFTPHPCHSSVQP